MAAAVSDFYIPMEQLLEHKIQSGSHKDGLTLELLPVPKMLGKVKEWNPDTLLVSFKLETDQGM